QRLGRRDAAMQRRKNIDALAGELHAKSVVLAGFDPMPPWLQQLVTAVQAGGGTPLRLAEPDAAGCVRAYRAPSAEQELLAAAQWVRAHAEARPDARIGVIIPALGARRTEVLRIFDQVLCPLFDSLQPPQSPRPYNLSLGEPLAQVGLVHCALQLLQLD